MTSILDLAEQREEREKRCYVSDPIIESRGEIEWGELPYLRSTWSAADTCVQRRDIDNNQHPVDMHKLGSRGHSERGRDRRMWPTNQSASGSFLGDPLDSNIQKKRDLSLAMSR